MVVTGCCFGLGTGLAYHTQIFLSTQVVHPCSTRNLLRPKKKRTQACFGACIVIDYISIWCACLHAYRRNINRLSPWTAVPSGRCPVLTPDCWPPPALSARSNFPTS